MEEYKTIGFIGQGFIGKHMADDFEARGYKTVRYALEEPYCGNKDSISNCDVVFIAVPTPTTPKGFDDSLLRGVLPLVGKGKIAVIKSTMIPGTTEALQDAMPECIVLHSPEFLREKCAADDTAQPARNIVGIPKKTQKYKKAAEFVLSVLPRAPYSLVCSAREAELIKYGGNVFLTLKLIYMNTLFDVATAVGANYEVVRAAMAADARIGAGHTHIIDNSGHKGAKKGRGAGGHCFPKDLAAFSKFYKKHAGDLEGARIFAAIEAKNNALLVQSGKDLELLEGVYGTAIMRK